MVTSPGRYRNLAIAVSILFLACQVWICASPAFFPSDDGTVFLGFRHLPTDHYAYMMYASQTARDGSLLVDNMFTTADQDGRFMMIGLALAGAMQRVFPIGDAVVWHVMRILFLSLFCIVSWRLVMTVFAHPRKALAAHAFLLFSGGLDYIVRPVFRSKLAASGHAWANFIDNPWNFSVFWASTNMVWVIPMTVLCALVLFELRNAATWQSENRHTADHPTRVSYLPGVIRGAGFALLWFVHPYSAIVWALMVMIVVLVPIGPTSLLKSIQANLPALAGPLIVGLFVLWSQQDPVVAQSNAQTGLWKLSYPIYIYPIVYGPWMLLAFAIPLRWKSIGKVPLRLLLIWFGTGFLMTLNPLLTGAKFQFSFFVPLALLEMAGLFALLESRNWRSIARRKPWIFEAALVLIAGLNSAAGLVADVNPPLTTVAATAPESTLAALEELKDLPSGGVLCDPATAQIVPWKSDKPVFVGQWFLSTRYYEKVGLVKWFFSKEPEPAQLAGFLDSANIRYVIYGPREIMLGRMPEIPGLVPIAETAGHRIWEWRGSRGVQPE